MIQRRENSDGCDMSFVPGMDAPRSFQKIAAIIRQFFHYFAASTPKIKSVCRAAVSAGPSRPRRQAAAPRRSSRSS
jgi:hypothetical protein